MDNRRILIVDDNLAIHDDFKKILVAFAPNTDDLEQLAVAALGSQHVNLNHSICYEITSAHSAEEALMIIAKAEQQNTPFAMVFMDVRMPPAMDGVTATKQLWKISPHTEVVLCSAYSDYSWDQMVGILGVSEHLLFLRKPFDAMEVRQLALSLTTKWNQGRLNRDLVLNLEDEVRRRTLETEEERAKRIEASKMASLGEMAAGIAHEINNPLAIIEGTVTQLIGLLATDRQEMNITQAKNFVDRINRTTTRIAKIVKGLLTFARSGIRDPFEKTEAYQIVQATLDFTSARFKVAGIELIVEIPETGFAVACRPVQLSQVIFNLLSNAYDAVQGQTDPWIKIESWLENDFVNISVKDSGPGVPAAIRDKILFPFFTTKEVGKGTGLGLSISKGIMESHGGRLFLDDGTETTFVLQMPLYID